MTQNIEVIGRSTESVLVAHGSTDPQVLAEFTIPGGTLQTINALRITSQLTSASLSTTIPVLEVQTGMYFNNGEGNLRAGWGYIGQDEEIYVLVSAEGALFSQSSVYVNHFITPGNLEVIAKRGVTPTVYPVGWTPYPLDPFDTAVLPLSGQGDEPMYVWFGGVGGGDSKIHVRFINGEDSESILSSNTATSPFVAFTGGTMGPWCKRLDRFYLSAHTTFGIPSPSLYKFDARSMTLLDSSTVLDSVFATSITATDLWTYILVYTAGGEEIWKFAHDDIDTVVEVIDIRGIPATAIYAVSDIKIYIVGGDYTVVNYWDGTRIHFVGFNSLGTPMSFMSWANWPALAYREASEGVVITPDDVACAIITPTGPYLYAGGNGMAGFASNIARIDLQGLPFTDPTIAVDPPTAAPGDRVTVTWNDIYQPTSTDAFAMFLETDPFTPTGISGTKTLLGSRASGVVKYTVPLLTAPGVYNFRLVYNNRPIYLATSNTLTVS